MRPSSSLLSALILGLSACSPSVTDSGQAGSGSDDTVSGGSGSGGSGGSGSGGSGGTGGQDTGEPAVALDFTTLSGKLVLGYQGWFSCPGDGSDLNSWTHWAPVVEPAPDTVDFDLWPDTSELSSAEHCSAEQLPMADGSPAVLFSSYNPITVDRHFRWMADAGIDGVILQRFSSELFSPPHKAFRDQVTQNVQAGAEAHGRAYALMYDITGTSAEIVIETIESDWVHLVDEVGLLDSPNYLHHDGLPVVGIWGFGFNDREGTTEQALELISFFQDHSDPAYRATVIGGVPTYWRTLTGDSHTDPAWAEVYAAYDVVSPWMVGRYADESGADSFAASIIAPDVAETQARGQDYMPVVFPGFSWANLTQDSSQLNQIPRDGGRFYWRQIANAIDAGAPMIFGAMFDEVDEGTALFHAATSASDIPSVGTFLTLDADGETLPADWYLQLTGVASEMLRGERPLDYEIPISP